MIYEWLYVLVLGVLGLVFGSFDGAQVWRLRYRQLAEDKSAGEAVDTKELKRLAILEHRGVGSDRSRCLTCGHVLAWYDLIPLASWLSTAGRCRYCKKEIGWFEPAIELSLASLFVLSYVAWPFALDGPLSWLAFVLWLVGLTMATILWVYDKKWFLLPDRINFSFIGVAAAYALVQMAGGVVTISDVIISIMVFCGLYGGLYYFSRWQYGENRTWVGFGDVKLSLALALFALEWQYALLAIFLANLLGTIMVLPGLANGSIKRGAHIPFGPLLLVGTLLAVLVGQQIINWYMGQLLA